MFSRRVKEHTERDKKKVLTTLLTVIVVIMAGGYGTIKYMNREHGPNLFE